ncbi:HIT domain-containing protein [Candidatus Gromoviella agglomerans]|uniref:HIT domain-containing protein n=1 Tax=Candidatus Gromoviella agglomerans TaxID=2806609 RepID=UPI001E63F922|nr:HIT domain-containing protein [Candidatus Gromoviella agglomerans]UFX98198.1 HIT-like protein [Candidatus Gromoviella agglomerans]
MVERNDIFSKIIRGNIPCNKVYESNTSLAFYDISPKAKVHVLVIPKKFFLSIDDFLQNATDEDILLFWKDVHKVTDLLKLSDGYRIVSNVGSNGNQEIPYMHIHILGGENLS